MWLWDYSFPWKPIWEKLSILINRHTWGGALCFPEIQQLSAQGSLFPTTGENMWRGWQQEKGNRAASTVSRWKTSHKMGAEHLWRKKVSIEKQVKKKLRYTFRSVPSIQGHIDLYPFLNGSLISLVTWALSQFFTEFLCTYSLFPQVDDFLQNLLNLPQAYSGCWRNSFPWERRLSIMQIQKFHRSSWSPNVPSESKDVKLSFKHWRTWKESQQDSLNWELQNQRVIITIPVNKCSAFKGIKHLETLVFGTCIS